MESFKSPASRLARLFKKSLDAWKAQVRIRELEQSLAYWKKRALAAESESAISREAGMCLIVASDSGIETYGEIRRIDVKDNIVVNISDVLATGKCPRFSPDGGAFVYLHHATVGISSVSGRTITMFPIGNEAKTVSWTVQGIWVGAKNALVLYSVDGKKIQEISLGKYGSGHVSANGMVATGWWKNDSGIGVVVIHHLNGDQVRTIETVQMGCGQCPSPDGLLTTQNLQLHNQMNILHTADGSFFRTFSLSEVTPYQSSGGQRYCWNAMRWSSHSSDWIVLPIGRDPNRRGSWQLRVCCFPWIYNIKTGTAMELAVRSSDFWQPCDYYSHVSGNQG